MSKEKIPAGEYKRRRKQLMQAMGKDTIAILPAAIHKLRNRDTEYPYRQRSDFLYLSGFAEPEAVIVLLPGRKQGEFIMFTRERDRTMEIWNGYRSGPEGAVADFGADDAFPIDDLDDILPGLMEGRETIYYSLGRDKEFDSHIVDWVSKQRTQSRSGALATPEIVDLNFLLHELRLFKSKAELRVMRRAAKIAVAAHNRAMQAVKPKMYEYELEAEYLFEFRKSNAIPAYNSIVGGGENGCILHYVENNQPLKDGELVLVDAGAEYQGYASDITRTFPVGGKFSKEQKIIYDIVLAAQEAALKKSKPGCHWNDPHDAAVKTIVKGLIKIGLLKGTLAANLKSEKYRDFYMHRTGHWLGLDTHDVGDYKIDEQWRLLEPGMVYTIEPGIYIAPDLKSVPKRWRGIGIRIEDDVVITDDGCEILTEGMPRTTAEVEAHIAAA